MKKIEKRTVVCLILTLILLLGVGLFVVRFFLVLREMPDDLGS